MSYIVYALCGMSAILGISLFFKWAFDSLIELTEVTHEHTDLTSTEPCAGDGYTSIEAGSQDNEKCYMACLAQSKRAAHRYFEALRVYHSYHWWEFGLRRYWLHSVMRCKADAMERSGRAEEFRQAMQQDQAVSGYYKGLEPSPPPLSGEHRRT